MHEMNAVKSHLLRKFIWKQHVSVIRVWRIWMVGIKRTQNQNVRLTPNHVQSCCRSPCHAWLFRRIASLLFEKRSKFSTLIFSVSCTFLHHWFSSILNYTYESVNNWTVEKSVFSSSKGQRSDWMPLTSEQSYLRQTKQPWARMRSINFYWLGAVTD